jgi:hypothetical protein
MYGNNNILFKILLVCSHKFLFIEPFGNISTSFVHPNPTAVVSAMNASKTSPSSQITLVKGQTSVPHLHSSVKGMIVAVVNCCCCRCYCCCCCRCCCCLLMAFHGLLHGGLFSLLQFTFVYFLLQKQEQLLIQL